MTVSALQLQRHNNHNRVRITCVIPAYNEERFIGSVVLMARQYADRVIVVDDGSSDRTAELAEDAGAIVVRHQGNLGKAAGLNNGFQTALELGTEVIVCLDGDAQHDPAEIPTVAEPILNGEADVVIGSRFLEIKSEIPGWRQIGQKALNGATNIASGFTVSDTQSGYRAFSSGAAQALRFHGGGLSVESEMQFLFEPAGLRVVEVPISVKYLDGNKRNPFAHGLEVLDVILKLVARRKPLLFFTVPGLGLIGAGLMIGAWVVYRMLTAKELATGTAMVTVLTLLAGISLSVAGVLLHSMNHFMFRVGEEVRSIIKEKQS